VFLGVWMGLGDRGVYRSRLSRLFNEPNAKYDIVVTS